MRRLRFRLSLFLEASSERVAGGSQPTLPPGSESGRTCARDDDGEARLGINNAPTGSSPPLPRMPGPRRDPATSLGRLPVPGRLSSL